MEKVYFESSFISYLVSRPSTNLIVAGHQRITAVWWEYRRADFLCFVSETVLDEISAGDPQEARKRLEVVSDMPVLAATEGVGELAEQILRLRILPREAAQDAVHIGMAAAHGIDFLLTWNCKHLANGQIISRIRRELAGQGVFMPIICTPEELMGEIDV